MKYLKSNINFISESNKADMDPYNEEKWDEEIEGYFICDRHRNWLNDEYAKNSIVREGRWKTKIYTDFESCRKSFMKGFFDDSDAGIYILYKNGEVERVPGYSCN